MTQEQSVLATHKDYDDALPDWEKVDNVIDGDVNRYLRNVARCEPDATKAQRQSEYEEGAILHNFTLRTRDGMQGAIFLRTPTIELPANIEYLLDDADGNGLGLEQHMQAAVDQTLRKGRCGLLVDMPSTEEVPTLEMQENGEAVPRIQLYQAQDIINWQTVRYGSINRLWRIVLREEYDASIFGNLGSDYIPQYQYRVLAINEEGYYYQQVWYTDKSNELVNEGMVEFEVIANGERLREIQFFFIGADDNSYKVGTKPLLPIADLNIGHYRNSADTEENSFVCSQAMLVIALSEQIDVKQFAEDNPNGVQVGSRRGLNVGPGGSAEFIQAAESDKAMRLMKEKEEQAIQLGAQLITPSRQVTAETARIQQGANGSILASIATNVTSAYRKAIESCMIFLGSESSYELALSNDFFYQSLTAQERAQWVSEVMTGITPVELFYSKLRQTGEYPDDIDNAEIERMIADQPPMGGFAAEESEEDADLDGDE